MTNINTRLCDRLAALDTCPACGGSRKNFHTGDGIAVAIYDCGADVMVSAGTFVIALGCRNKVADALTLIKAAEAERLS